jgi:hypothetical protein
MAILNGKLYAYVYDAAALFPNKVDTDMIEFIGRLDAAGKTVRFTSSDILQDVTNGLICDLMINGKSTDVVDFNLDSILTDDNRINGENEKCGVFFDIYLTPIDVLSEDPKGIRKLLEEVV